MSEGTPPAGTASLDAVKLVKAAETEWEAKTTAARKTSEAALARLHEEAEAAVAAARTLAEQERVRTVEAARSSADAEAATIVTAGEAAAQRDGAGAGRRPADRRTEVVAAVLGDLAGN
jgi:vacuolar-type H+-ATPase subunit H